MDTKYTIGLDIGTTSVGWAVVNTENFKVIQRGNKALWGVRLFEEATTAEARRVARGTRRRYDRRRKRIRLLQKLFQEAMNQVDPSFFQKLRDSMYSPKDRINKKLAFTEQEKKIIHKYPTIYHMRSAVMNGTETDLRLVYLAIHHIIKYRGNFRHEGDFKVQNLDLVERIKEVFESFQEFGTNLEYNNLEFLNMEKLEEACREPSRKDRQRKIEEELDQVIPKKAAKEFAKAMLGNKFNITTLFHLDIEKIETTFKGTSFEDNYDEIAKDIGNTIEVLERMKELYECLFLIDFFKGEKNASFSNLMIGRYEKHKEDLKKLKQLLQVNKEAYNQIFRTIEKSKNRKEYICIYDEYVHNKKTLDELQKEIKKALISVYGEETYQTNYENWVEAEEFLPRIADTDNGNYPYQLNKEELLKIIKTQGERYPFLLEKVESDNPKEKEDDKYKLVKILSFRIPYYVGPLNNSTDDTNVKNKNAWICYKLEKTSHLINPYNFQKLVDLDASAEQFIMRMISHCTYLPKQEALPSNSILYSKFKVLNEIKQITVNGKRLSPELQNKLYHDLFLTEGTVTEKKLLQFLAKQPEMSMYGNDMDIKGYSADKKFANSMQSYLDFFGKDGIFENTLYDVEDAEQIIEWNTIFEDKAILERKIRSTYSELSEEDIKKCVSKRYKGWGNLSRRLLTEIKTDDDQNIMELLEGKSINSAKQDQNFMQILNDPDYKFQEKIDLENAKEITTDRIHYKVVENLATSSANKRGIYQALKVVEEIVDYMKCEPQNICIEMARGEDKKKGRKENRKEYLEKLFKKSKKDIAFDKKLRNELKETDEKAFDNEKVFLYFIQQGKCLYTGKPIDIHHLEECEVDHIIPRTLIKDNSWDNKALVFIKENQMKAASLVLPSVYRKQEQIKWWSMLEKAGLISKKKFNALKRSEYSDKDIEGFIHRQLVETRQITKHVANILQTYYKNTNVVYLHANLSHNYRDRFDLFKFRELNDYHHAHDAYLAAVLGIYQKNVLKNSINLDLVKEQTKELYEKKQYKELGYGLVINSINNKYLKYNLETGEVKTEFDADKFNQLVEHTLYRNDILISQKTEIRTGEFYQETKNKHGQKGVPLKKNLPTNLYGSYTSLKPSYALIVKYTKKGKEDQRMIGMPILYTTQSKEKQEDYIRSRLGITKEDNIVIVKNRIPFNSLFDWNGQICMLVGAPAESNTVEVCNGKEFQIDREHMKEWKYTLKRIFDPKRTKLIDDVSYAKQLCEILKYIIDKVEKEYLLYQDLIPKMKEYFHYKNMEILTTEEREKSIIELLKLLNCNSTNANLKFLNDSYSSAFGKKNDRIISETKIVHTSVTGIYRRIES